MRANVIIEGGERVRLSCEPLEEVVIESGTSGVYFTPKAEPVLLKALELLRELKARKEVASGPA